MLIAIEAAEERVQMCHMIVIVIMLSVLILLYFHLSILTFIINLSSVGL